jgi:hypothetical protein
MRMQIQSDAHHHLTAGFNKTVQHRQSLARHQSRQLHLLQSTSTMAFSMQMRTATCSVVL